MLEENLVLKGIHDYGAMTPLLARQAGVLLGKTRTTDVVDALVVAEALRLLPALILTSDPRDIRILVESDPHIHACELFRSDRPRGHSNLDPRCWQPRLTSPTFPRMMELCPDRHGNRRASPHHPGPARRLRLSFAGR